MTTAKAMVNRAVVQAVRVGGGAVKRIRMNPLDWAAIVGERSGVGGTKLATNVGTLPVVLDASVPQGHPRAER